MMRRMAFASAFVLLTGSFRAEQAGAPLESVKSELRAFMAELNAARSARDRAALEHLYADDFLFVHALGAPVDKSEQIARAMTAQPGRSLPMQSFDGVLVYGDVAILRTPEDGRFGTTIYIRRNGRWQVLQIQGTAVPSSRPAVVVSADALRACAGRYQQGNGLFVTISVEGDTLALQVDGRQKLTLSAESDTRFSLPAGAGVLTFTKADDGRMSYELRRGNGTVIKGTRTP